MIVLPLLLFPLIFGVAMFFMNSAAEKAENVVLKYAIVGEQYAPEMSQQFANEADKFTMVDIQGEADYAKLIKDETLDFVLVIPETFNNEVLTSGQHKLQLYLNDAGLNKVLGRVSEIVDVYTDEFQKKRPLLI